MPHSLWVSVVLNCWGYLGCVSCSTAAQVKRKMVHWAPSKDGECLKSSSVVSGPVSPCVSVLKKCLNCSEEYITSLHGTNTGECTCVYLHTPRKVWILSSMYLYFEHRRVWLTSSSEWVVICLHIPPLYCQHQHPLIFHTVITDIIYYSLQAEL